MRGVGEVVGVLLGLLLAAGGILAGSTELAAAGLACLGATGVVIVYFGL